MQARQLWRDRLEKMLADENVRDARVVATALETGAFNAVIEACGNALHPVLQTWGSPVFRERYDARCAVLLNALDRKAHNYADGLIARIRSGNENLYRLGGAEAAELNPEALEKERKYVELRKQQQIRPKGSNQYRCPHCKQRNCTYEQVQNRSSDEAASIVCHCLECGRPFKG